MCVEAWELVLYTFSVFVIVIHYKWIIALTLRGLPSVLYLGDWFLDDDRIQTEIDKGNI